MAGCPGKTSQRYPSAHPLHFLFRTVLDADQILAVAVGDKQQQRDLGQRDGQIIFQHKAHEHADGQRKQARQRDHAADIENHKEADHLKEELPEDLMGQKHRDAQEETERRGDRLAAAELCEDGEAVADADGQTGVDHGFRSPQGAERHGDEGLETVQQSDADAGFLAQHAAGVGAAQVAGAFLADVLVIEDLADDESPGNRTEQIAENDCKQNTHSGNPPYPILAQGMGTKKPVFQV